MPIFVAPTFHWYVTLVAPLSVGVAVRVMAVPGQTEVALAPMLTLAVELVHNTITETVRELAELVIPQALVAVTETLPLPVVPTIVTVILFVPCPAVIVPTLVGTVQL